MKTNSVQIGATVPLMLDVDVLVVGAGSGAVAAAMEARRAGASVSAVSDRSFFGDESAGTLALHHLMPSDDPCFRLWFGDGLEQPLRPGVVKHRLEKSLLDAGVRFFYYARPVSMLVDQAGRLCGTVLASRTSLYAVGFRMVVDATRQGLVARLSRVPLAGRREPAATLDWMVLSPDAPPGEVFDATRATPSFAAENDKGDAIEIPAYRLRCARPATDGRIASLAAMEHRMRAKLQHGAILGTAEIIVDPMAAYVAGDTSLANDPASLTVQTCLVRDDLLLMNGALPLSSAGLSALEQPAIQIPLGRRIGQAAGELARHRRKTASVTDWSQVKWQSSLQEATGPFDFAPSFVRPTDGQTVLGSAFLNTALLGECDVLVAGGGTGGAPAGIAAARAGAKTVVLEMQHGLGGVGTLGFIASYYHGNRVGFTEEMDRNVFGRMGLGDYPKQLRWNPNVKDAWLQETLLQAGASVWFGSFAFGVQREGDRVVGVLVSTPYGCGLMRTGAVVDATGNADIAAAAGAPCRVMDQTHVAVQGTGLSPYRPGTYSRNSDHTFIDDCDWCGVTHAFVNARAKFPREFDVSSLVNSRERRQIHGEIELSPLDFLANRHFPDTITTARSNFDTHGFTVHPVFMVLPPNELSMNANVPFRCMLPRGVEGVIVTGLGISAHRDALPVIRMQADVQNQGFAAGRAAAMSVATGRAMRELDIRRLQQELVAVGILKEDVLTQVDSFPLSTETIDAAIQAGPVDHFNAAVLIAHPEQSVPGLCEKLKTSNNPMVREQAALLLGLLGDDRAATTLAALVTNEPWDQGWNYTGMGQFGRSMSRLDALIVALGQTASHLAVEPVLKKIEELDADAAFSHCRAVSAAATVLCHQALSRALAYLLSRPGVPGHAQLETAKVICLANEDLVETTARNLSLRELVLARGLYLCGDIDGLGRRILETYTNDLRGHYARHAAAVLCTK